MKTILCLLMFLIVFIGSFKVVGQNIRIHVNKHDVINLCCDNRFYIISKDIKPSQLIVTSSNGSITKSSCRDSVAEYYIVPDSLKPTTIEVRLKLPSGKLKLLAKKELTVIYPGRRNASFLGKTGGTMHATQAKVGTGLKTSFEGMDFDDVRTYMAGYTMQVKRRGNSIYYHNTTLPTLTRGGCSIEGSDREFLQNLQHGDSLIFKDIRLSFCDKKVFTSDSTIRLYID